MRGPSAVGISAVCRLRVHAICVCDLETACSVEERTMTKKIALALGTLVTVGLLVLSVRAFAPSGGDQAALAKDATPAAVNDATQLQSVPESRVAARTDNAVSKRIAT